MRLRPLVASRRARRGPHVQLVAIVVIRLPPLLLDAERDHEHPMQGHDDPPKLHRRDVRSVVLWLLVPDVAVRGRRGLLPLRKRMHGHVARNRWSHRMERWLGFASHRSLRVP